MKLTHQYALLVLGLLLLAPMSNLDVIDKPVPKISAQNNLTGTSFKFMTYNIEASGENADWKAVVKEENADIITFIETGTWDDKQNHLLDNYCKEFNDYFSSEAPYSCETTSDIPYETSGEAIFSRYPIEFTTQIPTVKLDEGTQEDVSHDFFHSGIRVDNITVHIIASHLKCCGGEENEKKRDDQQEGIINYMDSLGDVPVIYAGDLNSFSPEDTGDLAPKGDLGYGPVSMLLDQTPFQEEASTMHQFTDAYRSLKPSTPGYTYGHQDTQYLSRIDYIFTNQYVADDLETVTTGDTTSAEEGSDHFSVDTTLTLDAEDAEGNRYTGSWTGPDEDSITINLTTKLWIVLIPTLLISTKRNKLLRNTDFD